MTWNQEIPQRKEIFFGYHTITINHNSNIIDKVIDPIFKTSLLGAID